MGHVVDILTFTLQYPSFLYPGKSQYSDDDPPSLNIERGINSVNPLTWIKYGLKYRKKQYDLVISRFWLPVMAPSLGSTLRLISMGQKTKVITIVDNIIPHEARPGDHLFTRYFARSCHGFMVMSHEVERDMDQFIGAQPVVYSPHPIYDNYGEAIDRNLALHELQLDSDKNYILFFGFIRKYKGLDLLMKAFATALESNDNLHLIVAGEYYSDREYYESLVEELEIGPHITLHTDFIPNERVRYYFCACDIVAQPYRSATQSGISQLAIHFDRAILSTNVGGLPETTIHGETGYLTEVDEQQIAHQIIEHFAGPTIPDFTEGIRRFKKGFSWEDFASKLVALYKSL